MFMHEKTHKTVKALVVCLATCLGVNAVYAADPAPIEYRIEPQSVSKALKAFAAQSNMQLIFTEQDVRGAKTAGVMGTRLPREALEEILKGTGLEFEFTANNVVVIRKASHPIESAATRVSRSGDPSDYPKEGKKSSSDTFPMAQMDQGGRSQSSTAVGGAASAAQASRKGELQEIVVTAQKREERLQDVPLSVSAVTGEEIAAKGITSLEDLQYSVPGLSMASFGPGQENVQIRGVSGILGRPTTGQYLDEMSISGDDSNNTIHENLREMQRVEVLRGPQATLYGEGSMGGTIRYITTPPDLDAYSGSLEAAGGEASGGAESYRGNLIANVPLIAGTLGLRLVGGYEKNGGWIDNAFTGRNDVNGSVTKTVRAALRALPNDRIELSLLLLHQQNDQDNGDFAVNHVSTATVPTYDRDRYSLVAATARYDFDGAELVESAGYIDHDTQEQFDFTPYLQPILVAGLGVPPSFVSQIFNPESEWTRAFNDELRLTSNGQAAFNWTVGAFYRNSKMQQTNEVRTQPGSFPFEILNTPAAFRSSSYSLYAEGSYRLSDKLTALAGVRFYHDTEHIGSNQVTFGVPTSDFDQASFHSVNPRFNLRYEFSPVSMVYANAAEGFRSGGFNVGTPPGPATFAPDHIWTFEIGTKQELWERRLQFDGAVYYSRWSDVQSAYFPPGTAGIVVTENAGRAGGWGTDLSFTARLIEGLKLTATYGWNNLAFKADTADKNAGDPVDYAPRKSFSVSLDYRRALGTRSTGFLRADYQYSGSAQVSIRDFGEIIPLPARGMLNLRAGVDFGSFEASLFATNALNNSTPIQIGPYAAVAQNVEQRPRTVGVNLRLHF
jgi:iron complex outermembrane receptor protein